MSYAREKPQQPCEAMKLENVNSRGHELVPRVTSGGTRTSGSDTLRAPLERGIGFLFKFLSTEVSIYPLNGKKFYPLCVLLAYN